MQEGVLRFVAFRFWHAVVALRNQARRKIQRQPLRHLLRVARLAVKENPTVAGNFVLPDHNAPNKAFIWDTFDSAAALAQTTHLGHVGARANLEAVADECVQFAGILDGLNRARFDDNPEMLAAWIRASKVVGPFHFKPTNPAAPPEPKPPTVVAAVPEPVSMGGSASKAAPEVEANRS